jgi:hypothetical protein
MSQLEETHISDSLLHQDLRRHGFALKNSPPSLLPDIP